MSTAHRCRLEPKNRAKRMLWGGTGSGEATEGSYRALREECVGRSAESTAGEGPVEEGGQRAVCPGEDRGRTMSRHKMAGLRAEDCGSRSSEADRLPRGPSYL